VERIVNCEFVMDIQWIEDIKGADEHFEVVFSTKDKKRYRLTLERVWDMRYSIENASIDRFYEYRKCLSEDFVNNSVFVVEGSEYIKYFERQVSGTRPVDKLQHYVFRDSTDTVLDILIDGLPKLEMV